MAFSLVIFHSLELSLLRGEWQRWHGTVGTVAEGYHSQSDQNTKT